MFSIENPIYFSGLLLLIILIIIFTALIRWKKRVRKKIGDKKLIDSLTSNFSNKKFKLKYIIALISIFLGILAAVNFRKEDTGSKSTGTMNTGRGIDVIIALDVSKSMLAQDVKPTRLDQAKLLVNKLLDNLQNNRVGLVVFAGQAILQMPVTTDIGAAKMLLSNVNPDLIPMQGTEISDALSVSNLALGNVTERKHKAIILITDGENHDTRTTDAIKELQNAGVVVYCVGIGSLNGSPIFDPAINDFIKDNDGKTVISKLGTDELEKIAQKTNGSFFRLDNQPNAANKIASAIDSMEKKQIESPLIGAKQYIPSFPYLIGIILFLLIVDIFINERKRRVN